MDHLAKPLCGRALCLLALQGVCAGCAPPPATRHSRRGCTNHHRRRGAWVRHWSTSKSDRSLAPPGLVVLHRPFPTPLGFLEIPHARACNRRRVGVLSSWSMSQTSAQGTRPERSKLSLPRSEEHTSE